MRTVIAALVVVALIAGILAFWPRDGDVEASTTTTSTTLPVTTTSRPTTTSVEAASTVTTGGSHVVTSVEEAEDILRDLWFGWFEGIYLEDEDRIREVVANPEQVEAAKDQFGTMEFVVPPSRDLLRFDETEILHSDLTCLAIWSIVDARALVGAQSSGVYVLIGDGERWLFVSSWKYREDRWLDDCSAQLS